jgi:membrane fusion protein (multidrug efflux system)
MPPNNIAAKAQLQAAKAQVETDKAQITAAVAAVQSTKADVETAQINLGFTHLTAPIDGIPGIALQQVGALVSPGSGAITTVSTVDPIKVYFTASEQEYLDFARRYPTAESAGQTQTLELQVILADGITYPQKGKFFADRQVDVRTSTTAAGPSRIGSLRQPVRKGPYRNPNATGSPFGSATGSHGPSGHAAGRRGRCD